MKNNEKKKLEEELEYLYDLSKTETGELQNPETIIANPSMFGMNNDDMNYKEEQEKILDESIEIIESMASLFLDDNKELLNNKYLKNKILNDAKNLADMSFLQTISKRVILRQVNQLEMGDCSPRHFEMVSIQMREIRENIKQSTFTISAMENFYREIRNILGLNNIIQTPKTEENNIHLQLTTTQNLNDKLNDLIKDIQNKNNENKNDN